MNVLFLIFLICVSCISRANGKLLKAVIERDEDIIDAVFEDAHIVNSTVAKTLTKFSCIANFEGAELLIYGTNAWQFPQQDINLTLTYPPDIHKDDADYLITGFKVLLFVDTADTMGYINGGGLFQEYVSLSFVSPRVNMVFYQFWVYGTPKTNTINPSFFVRDLC